jgi:hypothetical protein
MVSAVIPEPLADETAAKLTHDRVLLHACGSHGDLTARRPVVAEVHLRQEAPQRRQIGKMANSPADGGTPGLVLAPDVVHGLAGDRDPAARFAGDPDHASRVDPVERPSGLITLRHNMTREMSNGR